VTVPKQRAPIPFPSKDLTESSTDLAARCQAGDVEAFETVYRQHAARLYTLACRMAGSPEDGEDLLQEIFLQAYRKLGSFKGDAALGTWLYRLALNHCLDFVRSRQAKMNKLTETLDAEASFEPTARRETPIARLDLERAVERLPEGCREAFVLHDVEGFDHKEVAISGVQGAHEAARHSARKVARRRGK
jgi:RNA polymerase sigma-70 factor (ECF subfamily)